MRKQLSVFYDGRTVGTLTLLESQQMQFEYSSEWSSDKSSFPVSISLPLDASFDPTTSHRFFANLLPEGNVRLQICRMLGISPDNDFVLLQAIGGDCAGALTITAKPGGSEKQKDDTSRNRYQEVSEDQRIPDKSGSAIFRHWRQIFESTPKLSSIWQIGSVIKSGTPSAKRLRNSNSSLARHPCWNESL